METAMKIGRVGKTFGFTHFLNLFLKVEPLRKLAPVLYRIDGAVQFVFDLFLEHYQPILDQKNAKPDLSKVGMDSLDLLLKVTFQLMYYPTVQNLYWEVNICKTILELLKLRLTFPDHNVDMNWELLAVLYYILKVSGTERERLQQMGGLEVVTNFTIDIFPDVDSEKFFNRTKKDILNTFVVND